MESTMNLLRSMTEMFLEPALSKNKVKLSRDNPPLDIEKIKRDVEVQLDVKFCRTWCCTAERMVIPKLDLRQFKTTQEYKAFIKYMEAPASIYYDLCYCLDRLQECGLDVTYFSFHAERVLAVHDPEQEIRDKKNTFTYRGISSVTGGCKIFTFICQSKSNPHLRFKFEFEDDNCSAGIFSFVYAYDSDTEEIIGWNNDDRCSILFPSLARLLASKTKVSIQEISGLDFDTLEAKMEAHSRHNPFLDEIDHVTHFGSSQEFSTSYYYARHMQSGCIVRLVRFKESTDIIWHVMNQKHKLLFKGSEDEALAFLSKLT